MRDLKVRQIDTFVAEQKDVDVDDARAPATRPPPATLALDRLGGPQQAARAAGPLALDDLVEESRLVGDTPGIRLDDAALTQDAHAFLTQPPPRRAEVARSRAEIRSEPEVDERHLMWSAARTARVI